MRSASIPAGPGPVCKSRFGAPPGCLPRRTGAKQPVRMSLVDRVRAAVASAFESAQRAGELDGAVPVDEVPWAVERPKRSEHGDLSTNLAMAVARRMGRPPRGVAEA